MSLLSLIEFAAGEFAGFEFASEERGLPVLTDLSVTGAAAIATVTFAARGIATSLLEGIAGVGSFTPRMQAVVPATLQAAGAGSFSIPTQMLRQSTLTIAGVVVPVWATVVLRETTLTAQGSALVDLRPGSPIVTNLTPAYDRVLRPYEQRSAVWK